MFRYRELLESLRKVFPRPVADAAHNGYLAPSIVQALEQIDTLKSPTPILGELIEPDYARMRRSRLHEIGRPLEAVIPELVQTLQGMFVWGHPRCQVNVAANPTVASVVGYLLPLIYNPNLASDESSWLFAAAEVRVAAMLADLVGYNTEQARGLFTFGGTGTLLYGLKVGLEKACPGASRQGLREDAVIFAGQQVHHSCLTVASWLGIGQDNVVLVPTRLDNSMDVAAFEAALRDALKQGRKIAGIVATMGSTDAFGVDDLSALVAVRYRLAKEFNLSYRPHLHADAVIGWAWTMFGDYDFLANPLGFRDRTLRSVLATHNRIQHLRLADSMGIDFHKTGYAPYVSSLVLFANAEDLDTIAHQHGPVPYLFQTGDHHPGKLTLETTRSAGPVMAALATLLLLGKEGYRVLLGHAVEMAEVLREAIESQPNLAVLNRDNHGPVTLLRAYPGQVDVCTIQSRELTDPSMRYELRSHNDYNQRIFERVQAKAISGQGVVLSFTDCYRRTDYGEPIAALKSYVLSPFTDESHMQSIIQNVLAARTE